MDLARSDPLKISPSPIEDCAKSLLTQPSGCDTIHIMPGITIDNVYETTEAARLIGIGYATLYRWIKVGKLTPIRIAGRTLIPKSEVERLKHEQKNQAAE